MSIFKKILPLIIVVLLSYWAVAPFFIQGFFPIHDDTQVARVFEMHKSLSDGMFPVRWVADLGYNYGYPIFNFYAPLAYYVGGLLMFAGFDALVATKIMMALGIILAGGTMYLFAKQFWGVFGGILSALLYVYAPYHAVETYVRGDVSELWAYAFIPLAFLGIYKIFRSPQPPLRKGGGVGEFWWVVVGSLGYADVILSHNLTAMMVTPFLLGFALYLFIIRFKKQKAFLLFSPLLFGILLSAFYWLPTLTEMKYTNVLSVIGGGSDYKDHFVCPMQLWNSPWGFAGSAPGCTDGMSFKLGKLHIVLTLLFFVGIWFYRKSKKFDIRTIFFFIVALVFSIFFMLEPSRFIWDTVPKMDFFQFPWRFLIMVSFTTAFLSGGVLSDLQSKKVSPLVLWIIGSLLFVSVIILNGKVFNPRTISNVTADNYISTQALNWVTSKISDEYMPQKFNKPKNKNEVPDKKVVLSDPSVAIMSLKSKTQKIEATIDTKYATTATLYNAYFPAWQFYLDNNSTNYEVFDKGIKVVIPEGKHVLTAVYNETLIEKIANFLSITGICTLILGIIIKRRITNYGKKST
jgi:hypothetical protein